MLYVFHSPDPTRVSRDARGEEKERGFFLYFFRHGTLTRADLAGEAFLFREIGSGTRSLFDEFIGDMRINTVEMSMELGLNETIKQAVMAGMGIALISSAYDRRRGRKWTASLPRN